MNLFLLIQILEFETPNSNLNNNSQKWWKRIAWAFLRPISDNQKHDHTGHKVRLQLYKPVIIQKLNTKYLETTEVSKSLTFI